MSLVAATSLQRATSRKYPLHPGGGTSWKWLLPEGLRGGEAAQGSLKESQAKPGVAGAGVDAVGCAGSVPISPPNVPRRGKTVTIRGDTA